MMAAGNLKEFNELFAPFDENYAMELAEKSVGPSSKNNNNA